MISSLICGKIMHHLSKKTLLYLAVISCSLLNIGFGVTDMVSNQYLFLLLGDITRFTLGFSVGIAVAVVFSLVPTLYPDTIA